MPITFRASNAASRRSQSVTAGHVASAWYRFARQHPAVAVTLCAPQTRAELDEDLRVLDAGGPLTDEEYAALAEHGERVRRHAGGFR